MVLRQGGEAPAIAGCLDAGSRLAQASICDCAPDVLVRPA